MNDTSANKAHPPHREPEGWVSLPANSPRQALDWSLVLLSQGIESVPEPTPGGWQLRVPESARVQASAILTRYEEENRPPPWQRELPPSGILFDWTSLAWAGVVVAFYLLQVRFPVYTETGLLHGHAVLEGEWWRLVTAVWLHADAIHLTLNLVCGIPLLALALGAYGSGTGFLAALTAGVAGNGLALLVSGTAHRSLGASGVVMGALGLITARSVGWYCRVHPGPRWALAALAAGVMLFLLLGASEGSDLVAHAGGWSAGLWLGLAAEACGRRTGPRRPGLRDLFSGFIAAAVTVLAWAMALGWI